MNEKSKRISALNGVKGWFIYFVVIYHIFNGTGIVADILAPIKNYGGFIVNYLFFMLSGFLTAYSFSVKKSKDRNFFGYIKGKLVRLYPLYLISNLWMLGYDVYIKLTTFKVSFLILVLTMQTGGSITDSYPYNVPCWFICTLMVCYIVHYLIRHLCKDDAKKYMWVYYGMFVLGLVLLRNSYNIAFLYNHNGEGFTNFFLGCILFEQYRLFKNNKKILYPLFLCGLLLMIFPNTRQYIGDARYLVIFIICPVTILLSLENRIVNKFFSCKLSQILGKISMCVFFIHTTGPLYNLPSYFSNYNVGFLVYILVVIVSSLIITFLLEKIPTWIEKIKLKINKKNTKTKGKDKSSDKAKKIDDIYNMSYNTLDFD